MSGRSGERQLRNEGQGLDIPANLKMSAAEADEKIRKARRSIGAFTDRFVGKALPSRVGEAVRRDFPEVIPAEELAGKLGMTLRDDRRQKSGTSRQVLFGSIGQLPVALSTSIYGGREGPDSAGRMEVWARAIAAEIPEVSRAIWPISGYGNLGSQTYLVEPEVPKEQFLMWGGPDSMRQVVRDRKRHPEAMRAFFSCFTQAVQFLKAVEAPAKGGIYLLPRDFAKFGGNVVWENLGPQAGEGRLKIRDLGLWQLASSKIFDREIIIRAYQWQAISQFLASNIRGVFGTDLMFSDPGSGAVVDYTDSRFRGKKPYLNSISRVLGGGTDLLGFVEEWNRSVSPLVQRISSRPGSVGVGDESLPAVPGYSDMVYTGSPIELIERTLKNHGLWIPAGAETASAPVRKEGAVVVLPAAKEPKKGLKKRQSGLRRKGEGEIIPGKRREREGKMAGIAVETLETGQLAKAPAEAPRAGEIDKGAELPEKFVTPEGYEELPRIARVPFYVPEKQLDRNPSIPIYVGSHRVHVVQDHEGAKLVFYEMLDPEVHVSLRTIGRDGQVEGIRELDLGFIPLEAGTEILIRGSGEDSEAVVVVDDNLRETTLPSDSDKIKKVLVVKIPRTVRTEKGAVDFSDIDPLLHAVIIYSKDGIVSVQRTSEKAAIYVPSQLIEALREAGSRFVPPAGMTGSAGAGTSSGEARQEEVEAERRLPEIKVDKARLIDSRNKDEMQFLAAAAKLLSGYQETGQLPEKIKEPGIERDVFVIEMENLREVVYHLEPDLQKKVLLAALGEEKQGMSLIEQFDRELDGLLLSWGVDLLK